MDLPPEAAMRLVPLTQRETAAFIAQHHRHNGVPRGDVIRVGLEQDGELVAVATAGRPVAAALQDGVSLEVTRVCVNGAGHGNACSMLYGAIGRAAKALDYRRLYTYTLASEPGTSPTAAGFSRDGELAERNWATQSGRDRYEQNLFGERRVPLGAKVRWRREL